MLHSPLDFITDTQFGVLQGSFQLGSLSTFHHLVLPRSLTSLCLPGILCLKAFWVKLPARRVRRKYSSPVSLPVRPPRAGFIPDVTRIRPHSGPLPSLHFQHWGCKVAYGHLSGLRPLPTPLWSVSPGAILNWMCHRLAGTRPSYLSADLEVFSWNHTLSCDNQAGCVPLLCHKWSLSLTVLLN